MAFGFGVNNTPAQPTTPTPPVTPPAKGGLGFGLQPTPSTPTPHYNVIHFPEGAGGGAYNHIPGQPNTLVNTGHTTYGDVPQTPGMQRDDIFPVGLGGANSEKAIIKTVRLLLRMPVLP